MGIGDRHTTGHSPRARHIGRKAIACGRIESAIESRRGNQSPRRALRKPTFTRLHAIVLAVGIAVGLLGLGGWSFYEREQARQRDIAEKSRLEQEKIASKKRQACYKTVNSTHQDLIGKVTYDQLYGEKCQ